MIGSVVQLIAVVAVAELLAVTSSAVLAPTVAVLTISPVGTVTWTMSAMVAEAPGANEPRAHEMGPVPPGAGVVHAPCVVAADRKIVPAGVASVSTTLVAVSPALLPTTIE